MKRSGVLTGLVLVAVAAASALAVVLVAWERERGGEVTSAGSLPTVTTPGGAQTPLPNAEPGPHGEQPAIASRSVLAPRILLFGDTLAARIDVVLDRDRVDPGSVRVAAAFSPWEIVGAPERVRRDAGSTTYLRTTYRLRCLTSLCVPSGQTAPLEFAPARVAYAKPGGETAERGSIRVEWPVLVVYSRFASASFEGFEGLSTPWRVDAVSLPPVSYRVAPGLALALLLCGSALFAAVGMLLLYRAWPRRSPEPPPAPPPPPERALSPLEQALELLDNPVRVNGAADQRRALELVAEELEDSDTDIAEDARVLAWSKDDPAAEDTAGLVARVRLRLEEIEETPERSSGNGSGNVV